jgi:ATP-dependent helicase/nuclease subunit A
MTVRDTNPTFAQASVIFGTDRHLLVGAGAGSGKTTTVVQALCWLVGAPVRDSDGTVREHPSPLAIDDLAAITYTNQAAADLKRKLRAALVAGGRRDVAMDVDAARIGTIHGFCGDLLRDHALRAGVAPGLRIVDEAESEVIGTDCATLVVRRAVEARDVPWLDVLLTGRRLTDVIRWVATLSADADRLARWGMQATALRPHERALLLLGERALVERTAVLAREGLLDFDRMIVATRDLLRDDADVRRAVQRQLRLLVIDEFQDVDPAQRDIAELLGGLRADDPQPTRLLLVGDPKQSIFAFRRADVTVWNGLAERFGGDERTARRELTENFRSRRGILAFVDDLIGSAMDAPVDESGERQPFEVAYQPLEPKAYPEADDAAAGPCVELLCLPAKDDGKRLGAAVVRASEAVAVAARIGELAREGVAYGDIAIVLSRWGALELYQEALRAAGIPPYALRRDGFWEAREVLDCLLALRAVRDPRDDVAMVGLLKGPFVGVRDDTLLALSEARGASGRLVDGLGTLSHEASLLARAQALLARFGALRDRVPVHQLLARLVEETGFVAALAHDADGGAQAVANVRKLLRLAAATPDQSLGEFLRTAAEARRRGVRVGPERLYRERSDVVTITTVHSAKGLEWPVVFWCELLREPHQDHEPLRLGRELFRVKAADAESESGRDAEYDALGTEVQREARAERLRLWYVAATRPRQRLVLSGVALGKEKETGSAAELVLRRFGDGLAEAVERGETAFTLPYAARDRREHSLAVRVVTPVADQAGGDAAGTPRAVAAPPLALPPAPVTVPNGRSRLSATQLRTYAEDPALWWRRYVFGFEGDTAGVGGRDAARGGGTRAGTGTDPRVIGDIAHDVLERYGFESEDIAELVEEAIVRHDPDAPDGDTPAGADYRARLRSMVEAATRNARWRELSSEPSARRELRFTWLLGDDGTVQGAFDLAAVRDGTSVLLDVKTGAAAADGDTLAARYAVQGATYLQAAMALTDGRMATFSLLRLPGGDEVAVGPDGLPDVRALVRRLRSG